MVVAEDFDQAGAVAVEELRVEVLGHGALEAGEARALHPLDHLVRRVEVVRIHLQPHVLTGEAEVVEQLCVLLGREDIALHRVDRRGTGERARERFFLGDLTRDPV